MADRAIMIGELSRRTGCNIETIRYYEKIGMIPAPARKGRYRIYDNTGLAQLQFVRRARELGFTLDEVRALLALTGRAEQDCLAVRDLAAAHLLDVQARIADLRRMEEALATSVQACDSGKNPGCPLIDTLKGSSKS